MPRGPSKKAKSEDSNQSLESKLWATADKLRGHLDAADYKHVVLGLIFLKYISDRFAHRHAEILSEGDGADPEDRDEYTAEGVFWVPASARWPVVQAAAKQTDIGRRIDDAMTEIEKENPKLKGILPKGYARPTLDQRRLGELVDLIGTIGLGTPEHQARDTLGRVYEYFLGRFASAEGKRGGEFYTPASVVRTLVAMLAPYKGRIYDPCCGSGGMFVQSEKFIEAHGGKVGDSVSMGKNPTPIPGSWPS
jgi:type I restriction enzyme M protein